MSNTENTRQFKVGDRVRSNTNRSNMPVGYEATLRSDCGWASGFSIVDDEENERAFFPEYWDLVAPATPARNTSQIGEG